MAVRFLVKMWFAITRIGITDRLDPSEARRISYVNYIGLLSLVYLVVRVSLSLSQPPYAFKLFCTSVLPLSILYCNSLHFYKTAKFAAFFAWVTSVFYFSYFYLGGFHGGTYVVLFSAVLWPFMLFNPTQMRSIFICLGYLIFCFVLLITLQYVHPLPVRVELNMNVVRVSTTILTVIFLLLISWYFLSSTVAAEDKLRRNARQMQLITDISPAYIAYVSADDLRYRFVNRRFEKSYGIHKKDIVGERIQDVIGQQNYQFALPYIEQVREGRAVSYENVFPVKEGKRWIMVNYVPDLDQDGSVRGIVVMSHDITEQKTIEENLRQSELRFRSLFENMIEGVAVHELIYDKNGSPVDYRILSVNPMFETHTQIKSEDAIGRTASDLYEASPPPFFDIYSNVALTGVPDEMEVYFEPMEKYFHISIFSPAPNQFVTVFDNISARKIAQQEMQRANEYLENVLESSPDGICIVDKDGRFLNWNTAAAELYGFSYKELENKSYREFYPDETKLADMLAQLRQNGFIRKYEIEMKVKDGSIVPFELSISLLTDEEDTTIGSVCIARDLSETKRTLTKLTKAYDELRKVKDLAEAANTAKSVFLANMSHELRTPLNAILGFSELMKRDPQVSAGQLVHLDTICRSGEHLLSLINDVLEFSKIEAGKLVAHKDVFDLHRLLLGLEEMFSLRAGQKGLFLEMNLDEEVPRYIFTDQNKLRQILINLLGNAIRYTNFGEISLAVSNREKPGDDNSRRYMLLFEIIDTGIGIPEEEQEKIFDAFFQTGDSSASRQGAGLGLSICRHFVHKMGGDIFVESSVGKGSRFAFTLPVQSALAQELRSSETIGKVIAVKNESGGAEDRPFRILVVDDHKDNRDLLRLLLEQVGFAVKDAENGDAAVAVNESWRPHLIWMDMRMPVMNGYDATRRIRAQNSSCAPVIIALTASAFEEDRAKVLDAGCDDFVRRPFRESEIFEKVKEHLPLSYIYEDIPGAADDNRPQMSQESIAQALHKLPEELVTKLRSAAELSDMEKMEQTVAEIGREHEALARVLAEYIDSFQYDIIVALLEDGLHDNKTGWRKSQ